MSMHIITKDDILQMEKQLRTNLINSLSGIQPANLIGTIDSSNQTNLAIFNSVMHIGAHPPLMGFIMRPVTVPRGTYKNIHETGMFTINHVHQGIYMQAHQTAARYENSEFDATGLTPEYINNFKAPFVKESLVKIGLKFVEEHIITSNNTILMIGEVQQIILEGNYLSQNMLLQLQQSQSMGVCGLETYYALEKISELSYAKTDNPVRQLL
jgi:flavin reductase (DIM6/NTAB) family NADH-FMN oxidoreductase RutF